MTQGDNTGNIIRITAAEAGSTHVDDLLKRQMSLRGETGITRDRGRKWYYQNWFVFMVAGLIAAIIGWALIEPLFMDMIYIQGPVQSVGPASGRMTFKVPGMHEVGTIRIKDVDVIVTTGTKVKQPDGRWKPVNIDDIHPGDRVGAYLGKVEHDEQGGPRLEFAVYLATNPPQSTAAETDTIEDASRRAMLANFLLFPVTAGMIGLFIGAADGLMCRLWRRVLLGGVIGLLAGLIGGFVCTFCAGLVYMPFNRMAMNTMTAGGLTGWGFMLQLVGRALGWAIAGTAMGLGQGLSLRSGRLLLYGFLGGLIGGLLGGMLFDPLDLILLGGDKTSGAASRIAGIAVIGATVGAMIGLVELLARDAWLRMLVGPLAGKEFLIFKDSMRVGASPKSDIYLFNDETVMPNHAVLRATGDTYEVENTSGGAYPVTVNGRAVTRSRLRHGDQIGIGRTVLVFQRKRG